MLVLRDPALISSITDPDLALLIEQRFEDICNGEDFDPDIHGFFVVVEAGDSIPEIEAESGCPILRSPFGSTRYGDPSFKPCFECLEEHPCCYEMVFVPGDGDFGIAIFIPKADSIDPELLALCAEYADPAP